MLNATKARSSGGGGSPSYGELAELITQFYSPLETFQMINAIYPLSNTNYDKLKKLAQGTQDSFTISEINSTPDAKTIITPAFNKENLRGSEAAKATAFYIGIDLVAGGLLEGLGYAIKLRSEKKIATKKEFDALPKPEKEEVLLMLAPPESEVKLLAEGANWTEGTYRPADFYMTPQGQGTTQNIIPQLPEPRIDKAKKSEEVVNAFNAWRKEKFGGAFGQMSEGDTQALKELYLETTGIDIDREFAYIDAIGKTERIGAFPYKTKEGSTINLAIDNRKSSGYNNIGGGINDSNRNIGSRSAPREPDRGIPRSWENGRGNIGIPNGKLIPDNIRNTFTDK